MMSFLFMAGCVVDAFSNALAGRSKKKPQRAGISVMLLLVAVCCCNNVRAQPWVTSIGGTGSAEFTELAVGPDESVYVAGFFQHPTFPDSSYNQTGFYIGRWSASGAYLWAKPVGLNAIVTVNAIAVDEAGAI